jgi:predicted nuclease with RNAse H fold
MRYADLTTLRPDACVGIDLAGVAHRETGVAVLRDGRLDLLTAAGGDDEILALAALAGPGGTVAVNAPLGLPRGRCCLDDDCPCRHDPGTRSRGSERELLRMGVPILATALIKILARRGYAVAAELRRVGWEPLEVYPFGTLKLLGLPTAGKRTLLGRRRIHDALRELVPGLDHPDASEHQLDAVVCALTAHLWRQGRARAIGAPDEGLVIVPDIAAVSEAQDEARPALRRVAEERAPYCMNDPAPEPGSR